MSKEINRRYFETTNRKLELQNGDRVIVEMWSKTFTGTLNNNFHFVTDDGTGFAIDYIIDNHKIKKDL